MAAGIVVLIFTMLGDSIRRKSYLSGEDEGGERPMKGSRTSFDQATEARRIVSFVGGNVPNLYEH